jgi:hypothetical protein
MILPVLMWMWRFVSRVREVHLLRTFKERLLRRTAESEGGSKRTAENYTLKSFIVFSFRQT